MNDIKKVLLATPSYDGRFDVRYVDSLIKTLELCAQNNIKVLPYFLCYDSLIQRARNDYFKVFYNNKELDVLFFIDSDMGWNPNDFIKLVNSDKDMIGATYRKKTDNEELYAFKALGEDENTFEITPDNDGLLKIAGIGYGFLKISRNCADMLFENEPNFYYGDKNNSADIVKNICECVVNKNNHFVSEDIIVGYKWRQMGGDVFLDTKIQCSHVGAKDYTGDVQSWLDNWRKMFAEQSNRENKTSELISKYFTLTANNEETSQLENPKSDIRQEQNPNQPKYDDIFKVL